MNGIHDVGGMHGFGPIRREEHEPPFHHEWERRAFALTLAAGFLGRWNLDVSRSAREHMPADAYLQTTYYEHWLFGLERLLVERGLLSAAELAQGRAQERAVDVRPLAAEVVESVLRKGGSARVEVNIPARFAVGAQVRTRNIHPGGHTRLPRYARAKLGVIAMDHGVFIFPDTHAQYNDPKPQHVYSVRFTAQELWGDSGHSHDAIHIDLWDDYLDPAC